MAFDIDTNNIDPRDVSKHTFIKSYKTLQEGIIDLFTILPNFKDVFIKPEYESSIMNIETRLDDVTVCKHLLAMAVAKINESFPSLYSPDFPNTYSLNVKSDSFYFRSKDKVALAWEYNYSKINDNKEDIVDLRFMFHGPLNRFLLKTITEYEDKLTSNGYTLFVPRSRRFNRRIDSE